MAHNKEFLKKYDTKEHGIVQMIDKVDYHPITKEPGLWYKVKLFNSHYAYVLQKDMKPICSCISHAERRFCSKIYSV